MKKGEIPTKGYSLVTRPNTSPSPRSAHSLLRDCLNNPGVINVLPYATQEKVLWEATLRYLNGRMSLKTICDLEEQHRAPHPRIPTEGVVWDATWSYIQGQTSFNQLKKVVQPPHTSSK